jgi:hypothetical protein
VPKPCFLAPTHTPYVFTAPDRAGGWGSVTLFVTLFRCLLGSPLALLSQPLLLSLSLWHCPTYFALSVV